MNKLRKKIEEEGVTYSVTKDSLEDISPELERAVEDGDTVKVTQNESKGEENEDNEVDSLYSDADDRAIEYGVKNEAFNKLLESLGQSTSPKVNINENISESVNPRIKKSELINYFKNKK